MLPIGILPIGCAKKETKASTSLEQSDEPEDTPFMC
jgi:hypothetical protein